MRAIGISAGSMALWISACVPTPPLPSTDSSSTAAVSTGSTSSGTSSLDTTGGASQTPTCAEYLACLAEIAPDEVEDATIELGPDGTCWQDATTATACDTECTTQLELRCAPPTTSSGSETGEPLLKCAIESLVPGMPSPIDAGTGVGQLPPPIGDVLERNCGCHFVDPSDLERGVPPYNGMIELATWQNFQNPFNGVPTWQRVRQRAVIELSMPVPFYCDAQDLGSLSTEDHALLDAWLTAEAPDGASWP